MQVLFPLLALVPLRELEHTAAGSDAAARVPLLGSEGGSADEEGGRGDRTAEADLDSQQAALRADLEDVSPLGEDLPLLFDHLM